MDIKLIAFDLDGTALNSKKEISPRTLRAIQNAVKSGKIVIPATGRSLGAIHKKLMGLKGYFILNNGTTVASMPEREILFSHVFKPGVSLSLLEQFKTYPCIILAAKSDCGMIDQSIERVKDKNIQSRFREIVKAWNPVVMDVEKAIQEDPSWVNFFTLVFTDEGEWQRTVSLLKQQEGISVSSSAWGCVDIMPPGINKGKALRFIMDKLSLKKEQVMAIGDNLNDLEMLQNAGIAVAMSNSVEAIKEMADRITLSCDEDGVALAIEEIL